MGIILAILRIAGLILLAVLVLFLFLAALVLLVPVRYRMEAFFDGTEEQIGKPQGCLRITWLCHLLSVSVLYGTKKELCLRVVGIRLRSGRRKGTQAAEKEEPEKQETKQMEPDEPEPERGKPGQEESGSPSGNVQEEQGNFSCGKGQEGIPEQGETGEEKREQKEAGNKKPDKKKESLATRFCRMCARLKAWLKELVEHTLETLEDLAVKIRRIGTICSRYLELAGGEDARHVAGKTVRILKRLISHVKPRRISADLEIGTGDPASTGNIFAILGMLYPVLDRKARFIPDFERKRLAGYIRVRGRIRAGTLLFHGLCMVADRRLWRLIRQLKKGGNI